MSRQHPLRAGSNPDDTPKDWFLASLERCAADDAISRMMEIRDLYTLGHQQNVAQLARMIGQDMGMSTHDLEGFRIGSVLHDIGKQRIPSDILSKLAKLTAAEYELVKSHCMLGYSVLSEIDLPWPVADMMHQHQHHERIDGYGYPRGLRGKDITLEARIIAVADTVECVISHRPYRSAPGLEKALGIIRTGTGTSLDAEVVDVCCSLAARGQIPFA